MTPPPPASPSAAAVSADQISLKCLLVSGNRHVFTFPATTTVQQAKKQIFQEWPKEKPESPGNLRLLYLGKFLLDNTLLVDNRLVPGQTSTVHLTVKAVAGPEVPKPTKASGGTDDDAPACQCTIL
ncbi:hypothetical protein IWQ60_008707 [Tieghemiomyces parasiticus]|uniref:Ubiquitin-like domain-containing protein n=1 Tax=Tieghemiomyces parasiticus TaxID=78921 RepID=A0A9W7ZRT5_9FUNG|nr:hypothetical protein IWQ60_008707 [Tieghemiomyces parasiticus]